MTVNIPGLISVIVFYLLILFLGLWAARRKKGSNNEELMLAGREIGIFIGIFTMTATWVGGGFINGTAEAVYKYGLVWCQAPFGYAVSMWASGYFFADRMRSQRYLTMLDPLQKKYGDRMGGLLYLPALSGDLFWTAAILGALGTTLAVIVELPFDIAVIISASVAVLYTLFGGLYSVVYTDVMQLICIFIGLWVTVPFAMTHEAVNDISLNYTTVWIKDLDPAYSGQYIDSYSLIIFGGVGWQVVFQRILSARTSRIARLISYAATIGCLILTIPPLLIGAIGAQTDWNQTAYKRANSYYLPDGDEKYVLPLVMQYLCPPVVSFIGLGAVAAAVMSSADSSVLSASGMFSKNIYKGIFRQKASEREISWVLRISILCCGAVATTIAIVVESIYDLFLLCSDFVYVMLFPQLTCVIYFEDVNTYGSLVGYFVGLFFRLAGGDSLLKMKALIKYPWYSEESEEQMFPYKTFAMIMKFTFVFLISHLTNFLFRNGYLSKQFDVFKCIVNLPDESYPTEPKTVKENAGFCSDHIEDILSRKTEYTVTDSFESVENEIPAIQFAIQTKL